MSTASVFIFTTHRSRVNLTGVLALFPLRLLLNQIRHCSQCSRFVQQCEIIGPLTNANKCLCAFSQQAAQCCSVWLATAACWVAFLQKLTLLQLSAAFSTNRSLNRLLTLKWFGELSFFVSSAWLGKNTAWAMLVATGHPHYSLPVDSTHHVNVTL